VTRRSYNVTVFALGAYVLVERSGERVAVIGTAKDIPWGEVITQADLMQVMVAKDPALRAVPWSSAGSIVGQRAALDLQNRPGRLRCHVGKLETWLTS